MNAPAEPAKAMERQWIIATDLERQADDEVQAGRLGLAISLRRRARGHRSAATRIARRQGWA